MIYIFSDTDLDGYGTQLILSEIYPDGKYENIRNSVKLIKKIRKLDLSKNDKIIITDISPTLDLVNLLNSLDCEKLLFDHHETGISFNLTTWIHIDILKCSTELIFDYFKEKLEIDYSQIVKLISIYDLWKSEDIDFYKALSLNDEFRNRMKKYKSVDMLNRGYLLYFIKEYTYSLIELDINAEKDLNYIDRAFCNGLKSDKPLQMIESIYLSSYIDYNQSIIEIEGIDCVIAILTDITNEFQYISHYLLDNGSFDIVIHYNQEGKMSFRSNKFNVAKISAELFEGGGHKLAAGGKLPKGIDRSNFNEVSSLIFSKISGLPMRTRTSN